ncbi:hypothetical protein [Acinetobacter pseudolwoffii]|uniref:hypothetical protein n=1 Tax=Acinetobacter pseudolwoffii TaxID=2053287 RepID=UPI0039896B9D
MSEFFLRTESIRPEKFSELSVTNVADKLIIDALKSSEPCLLEGARGTGKSFLMRIAEQEIEYSDQSSLCIFIPFSKSSLIDTIDRLQFYHWMLAKLLKFLLNKLKRKGLSVSFFSANLLSNDSADDSNQIETNLKELVTLFENSYEDTSTEPDISQLPDIEDVKEAIQDICESNNLNKIYFFFDEAAHVFRPEQQRQFFTLFKDLRSPYIVCNAAIYPGVTYFGSSFELTHDCIYKKLERNIKDQDYLSYFREIVYKQADDSLKIKIEENTELFNTLALASGGNPRMLLKTIQDINKFDTTSVRNIIKNFYRTQIWTEHTDLGTKYSGHKNIIDWGRDLLENKIIPTIQQYNVSRQERDLDEATIYFWVHKDAPTIVHEALRLLTYTGIIKKDENYIKATKSELGNRFEVKYGCIISLDNNPTAISKDFFRKLNISKFPEFGKTSPAFNGFEDIVIDLENEESYKSGLNSLLQKSITVLDLLTKWQKDKLLEANILTLEQLLNHTEEQLIDQIYGVGPHKARIIKNAANAEILEYISG